MICLRRSLLAPSSLLLAIFFLTPGCGSPTPTDVDGGSDGGPPIDAPECSTATDCDDGLFCNGAESCTAGRCVAGAPQRCDDGISCTVDACSEELRTCLHRAPDTDGDGSGDASCLDETGTALGDDCDDTDGNRFPGNAEVCDPAHHDEDCVATTYGAIDADGDGFESDQCCNGTACGDDCNDGRRDAHPGATEVCNLLDDDCDAMTDEGVTVTVYTDADFDGDGDRDATAMQACASTAGVSVYHTDCADDDRTRSGRLVEVCDTVDNDCNDVVDDHTSDVTWYRDADSDGFGSAASGTLVSCIPPVGYSLLGTDCDDTTNARSPARAEICDGLDDDCNGAADFRIAAGDFEDDDHDGIADSACGAPLGRDCDDRDPSSGPGTTETCDGRDNDCDTHVDEDAMSIAFFRDEDGDGFGSAASGTIVGCVPSAGYVRRGGDCDDANAVRRPGANEGCNALDDDCDGAIDEATASAMCSLPNTQQACIAGVCTQIACADGYADCTFTVSGCETNVATDAANCGRCGSVCGGTCMGGVCMPSAPIAHFDARVATSVTSSAGHVTTWADLTSGHHDLTTWDGTPTAVPTAIGTGNAINLAASGLRTAAFPVPTETTFAMVVRVQAVDGWGSFAHHGSRDTDWSIENDGLLGTGGTTIPIQFQSAGQNGGCVIRLTVGLEHVLVVRVHPDRSRDFLAESVNGRDIVSDPVSAIAGTAGQLYVGASDAREHSNLVVGEIVYFDHAISDAARDDLVRSLRSSWGF
ncbi:MAG: putative metal-binding motif-containing protein [Sandaracinus sp.]